jgi:folate-dependent phosphoribosylglycinamide formyltransferase PurN
MKFIYFGTPDFSARLLERLVSAGFEPVAVVTNPDRPVGRKKIITPPPVKQFLLDMKNREPRTANHEKIEILQPEKLDAAFLEKLKSFGADVFVVFAYNKIFRKELLAIPRLGVVGVHPSFLPKYRGPSPFQSALLNGETETGVTLYRLVEGVDSGPIVRHRRPSPSPKPILSNRLPKNWRMSARNSSLELCRNLSRVKLRRNRRTDRGPRSRRNSKPKTVLSSHPTSRAPNPAMRKSPRSSTAKCAR